MQKKKQKFFLENSSLRGEEDTCFVTSQEFQNNWKNKLVDPSPNERRSAGLTKALHKGHVLSLSNLHRKIIDVSDNGKLIE